jgi:hypothetical protein
MEHSKQTDPRSKPVLRFCIDRATTLPAFSTGAHDFELPALRKRSTNVQISSVHSRLFFGSGLSPWMETMQLFQID